MGHWRTVNLIGTCEAHEVAALEDAVDCTAYAESGFDFDKWGPLCNTGGLCGLGNWPAEVINCRGNLSERDYSAEDVAKHLRRLVEAAPSLELAIHCGGDYESLDCVATVVCKDGKIEVLPPQVEELEEIAADQIELNLYRPLLKPRLF